MFNGVYVFFSVACGESHTVVITRGGELYSCGNNDFGQLGHDKGRKRLREYFELIC